MKEALTDYPFLGREFLNWLWYKSEQRNGTVSIGEAGEVEIFFVRRIILESGDGEYAETVSCQGVHSDMKEGKAALREGKKIKEARIRLRKDVAECEFTFKADRFQIQSLKMPQTSSPEGDQDRDGMILERIYFLEMITEMMDRLFSLFLEKRLSPHWSAEEMPKMKKWIASQDLLQKG